MINIFITTLIYVILISCIYFSKKKMNTKDNKIYSVILFVSMAGIVIDITQAVLIINNCNRFIILLFNRLFIMYINIWTYLFAEYILNIGVEDSKINKLLKTISRGTLFVFLIASIFLPIDYFYDGTVMYSFGLATKSTYVSGMLFCTIMVISMLYNYNKVEKNNQKKYLPFIVFVFLTIIGVFIQSNFPEVLIISPLEAFLTVLTYFFIENPDVAMIEQLNIARDQADRANNAKSEFLSSMSHEIRTPLNAIVGFSQALAEEDLSPQAEDEVKDIMMASETLLELVNGILDISKIEANKLEIVGVEYKIQDILDELVSLTRARLGEKPLDFRVNIADDLPKYLYGDKVRVKQVILNLLTNSVKYTKEGWFSFNVNCIKRKDMCRLLISVEDSGIGIKPESIDKLFSKFERLDIEKNNTIEGTGLGLAITKKLVDLMGGKIVVQSIYGKGSKFTLAIDQRIVENPTDTSLELTQTLDVEKIKALDLTGKRILVVDDNKINLKVATRLLSDYKCIIEIFDNGFSCIEKFEVGAHYDLILMDDMMPKMSGVETFHKLKEIEGFNTPVVALTANAISGMREKYLAEGFDDYLSKPIDKKELQKVLNKFLGNKNA